MLSYLDLLSTDAAWNLAAEQVVFDRLPRDRSYFMLWQNARAVIIGRHQNTAAEVNEAYVQERGVQVVRRLSGGGAVYHDMGNLNYTMITDAEGGIEFERFCRPVMETLRGLGVRCELSGRNDLTVQGRKFSGNAQYRREGRVMHHGTILFDSDLSAVSEALRVDPEKIRAKGIQSVRSRVANLKEFLPEEVTLPQFRQKLLEHILKETPGTAYRFTEEEERQIAQLVKTRYGTWEWNWGASPACTILKRKRFPDCGLVEVYIEAEAGRIRELEFRGDFFSLKEPEGLRERFLDRKMQPEAYREALEGIEAGEYFSGLTKEELLSLLEE